MPFFRCSWRSRSAEMPSTCCRFSSDQGVAISFTPIAGLYAAGNASAPVMGHTYAGPGATIGPALVFGYLAVDHMAEQRATDAATAGKA